MASRKEQKEAARQRRLAEEQARAERARRDRRLRMLGGTVVGAIAIVAVLIAISSGGGGGGDVVKPNSAAAKKAQSTVNTLLTGIPQQGNTLGSSAKVTVTEYGDLVCPVCKSFALGAENQLISNDVRSGKVKVVYKALETASQTANNSMFVPSQTAMLAAGNQKKAWNYIELFYHEQGDETQSYVTDNYLGGLAKQVQGLNFNQWSSDRQSSSLSSQVTGDMTSATAAGYDSTPTILVSGPKSQAQPIVGDTTTAPWSPRSNRCHEGPAPQGDAGSGDRRPGSGHVPHDHPLRRDQAGVHRGHVLHQGAELGVVQAGRRPGGAARADRLHRDHRARCSPPTARRAGWPPSGSPWSASPSAATSPTESSSPSTRSASGARRARSSSRCCSSARPSAT